MNKISISDQIKKAIFEATKKSGFEVRLEDISLEHPAAQEHGDFSANIALKIQNAKGKIQNSPRGIAEKIVAAMFVRGPLANVVDKIQVEGPGFINFWLSKDWLTANLEKDEKNQNLKGKKIIAEFTDPNPFKELHVGHIYSNTVGETICRLLECCGAIVRRVTYQGDVGLHVAKSIWGIKKIEGEMPDESAELKVKAAFLGKAYALGATTYEDDTKVKEEINALNKKIYDQDVEIKDIFDKGKRWSLEYFEKFYAILGTKFEKNYFESEAGKVGLTLVKENLGKVFEESDGAIVFRGEKYGLHTRVFVNSMGLPTYEAKELGLALTKYQDFKYDLSIIITGNEIDEYFRVLLKALSLISPDLAAKTVHLSHGMVRLPEGKMSSRTGKVVTGPWLISEAQKLATEKMKEKSLATEKDSDQKVAVAAIKYAFLRSSIGHDIEFNFEKSIDFEGDSGPYLQYTYARARSVLRKSQDTNFKIQINSKLQIQKDSKPEELTVLRYLYRFPEIVEAAAKQYAPNLICSYLFEMAKRFNNLYNNYPILGNDFRLRLTEATAAILKNGLNLLGIEALERM